MTSTDRIAGLEALAVRCEVVRDIDVPKGAWPWIEDIAIAAEGPHRRIETPRDAELIVFWHNEKPAAIVLNIRDQLNRSIQYRFDFGAQASILKGETGV